MNYNTKVHRSFYNYNIKPCVGVYIYLNMITATRQRLNYALNSGDPHIAWSL